MCYFLILLSECPITDVISYLLSSFRCCQIMGRSEQDELSAAQIFYPCMQCADIFFLKVSFHCCLDSFGNDIVLEEYYYCICMFCLFCFQYNSLLSYSEVKE